jgi:alanyl-tRNA synthetase
VKLVAIFLAAANGPDKVLLVAGISRDLVAKGLSAGDWVKETAPVVGGGGGGKPDLAQAGGKQPENIRPCLKKAAEYMTGRVVS